MTDRVSDMLIRIKNAYLARGKIVELPYFSLGEKLAKILVREGFLAKVEVEKPKEKKFKILNIELAYKNKKPAMAGVKIISKPGIRVYLKAKKLKELSRGLGISIISTSLGLVTDKEARKKNLGGEVICKIW